MKGKDTSVNFVIISQRKNKCDSKFTTVTVLKQHMQSQHEEKEFSCEECSYISRSHKSLKIYKHTKHGSAVYE